MVPKQEGKVERNCPVVASRIREHREGLGRERPFWVTSPVGASYQATPPNAKTAMNATVD